MGASDVPPYLLRDFQSPQFNYMMQDLYQNKMDKEKPYIPPVDSLPTSGYNMGAVVQLTTTGVVYISTEAVTGTYSWKNLW